MYMTIKNIETKEGPVGQFEIDMSKSLVVMYGGNNTGKSCVMQTLYSHLRGMYYNAHYLPATRAGLYQAVSHCGCEDFEGLPMAVRDYCCQVGDMRDSSSRTFGLPFAKKIESEILKGKVVVGKKKNLMIDDGREPLELWETSAMVTEMSLLAAFLKFVFWDHRKNPKNRALFIEEPEAHLHPENQVRLIEILAELSKTVILVISTHSNYFFNKLNNMVLAGELDGSRYAPILLVPGENGSVAKHLEVTEFGIEDENFLDVTDRLWREREDIIERRNGLDEGSGDAGNEDMAAQGM